MWERCVKRLLSTRVGLQHRAPRGGMGQHAASGGPSPRPNEGVRASTSMSPWQARHSPQRRGRRRRGSCRPSLVCPPSPALARRQPPGRVLPRPHRPGMRPRLACAPPETLLRLHVPLAPTRRARSVGKTVCRAGARREGIAARTRNEGERGRTFSGGMGERVCCSRERLDGGRVLSSTGAEWEGE